MADPNWNPDDRTQPCVSCAHHSIDPEAPKESAGFHRCLTDTYDGVTGEQQYRTCAEVRKQPGLCRYEASKE